MESEAQINRANEVIRHLGLLHTKRRSRIHAGAAEDNFNRLRALEGLCGQCKALNLYFKYQDGKEMVSLGCDKKFSPLRLYQNTPLEQSASCQGFTNRNE